MSQFLCSGVNSYETTKVKYELAPSLGEGIRPARLGIQGSNQIRISTITNLKASCLSYKMFDAHKTFPKRRSFTRKGEGKPIISNLVFCFQHLNTEAIIS